MKPSCIFSFIKRSLPLLALLLLSGLLTVLTSCGSDDKAKEKFEPIKVDAAYGEYLSAYTAGVINSRSTVKIRFASPAVDSSKVGSEVNTDLFDFSPSISGNAQWIDIYTIEFVPSKKLTSGQVYEVEFQLGKVIEVPENLAAFKFNFQIIKQDYQLTTESIESYSKTDLKKQKLNGYIKTADFAKDEDVEKLLSAKQDGDELKITWTHGIEENKHEFVVEQITRKIDDAAVKLLLDGSAIGVEKQEDRDFVIPGLNNFKVMDVGVVQTPSQFIRVRFSDPLDSKQDLKGLITVSKSSNPRFTIDGNEVRIYSQYRIKGKATVYISTAVQNSLGYGLKNPYEESLAFEQTKPALKVLGDGVILPSSEGLIFSFEAVSLKGVDLTVTEVFQNNILQFFQVNDYSGSSQMRRVSRPVLRKSISLNNSGLLDLDQWNNFSIDLSEFIIPKPGAMYQVQLGFRRSQSAFYCGGSNDDDEELKSLEEEDWETSYGDDEYSAWDDYNEYYYPPNYDWKERDNPCSSSYYGSRRWIKRNVVATDIGMIAKQGSAHNILVVLNDIRTTEPMSGAEVTAYDYQQQVIAKGTTDEDGKVLIDLKRKPYILMAQKGDQRTYLKIEDGRSLSLSNFDISGTRITKGIKGFIYGERGVWRPGDTLFLTFMLEDKGNQLPDVHPVVFELVDPNNQVVQKITKTTGVNDVYAFTCKTDPEAITGYWTARVSVGGTVFTKSLKIETVKPNRLKINLDFGKDKIVATDQSIEGDLEVKWLHGAKAKNLKAEFEVLLTKGSSKFSRYSDYIFEDLSKKWSPKTEEIFKGRVDNEGKAKITATLDPQKKAPGVLTAHFKGKVFEEGGDFSLDRFSIPYYPYETMLGLRTPEGDRRGMLLTDTNHVVDIVCLNPEGEKVDRKNVKVELYKMEWKWWWHSSNNDLASYVRSEYRQPIQTDVIDLNNGSGEWKLRVNYPEWGRYYIRVTDPVSGHSAAKIFYMDWPGWANKAKRNYPGAATMYSFSADKEKYEVGETVHLSLPGGGEGRALISVENGSRVVSTYWIDMENGKNHFPIKVTKEMAPNIFVHATVLQPHAQTVNDLPIRRYGVVPISIDDPKTHLEPQIKMKDVLAPGKKINITVSENQGRAMTYTVAVVDEGLLDLTRFKTPDPWNEFYKKEALGVRTWDMYQYVMGAYGGKIQTLMGIGGDGEAAKEGSQKANRFKPVVTYLGPFKLDVGEKQTHSFTMPQYVGSVRTMVVARHEASYGNAEKATPVRQPLMVLATLPRVVGPKEKVKLPVNVFAYDESVKNVKVKVTVNDMLNLQGSREKTITFSEAGDQIVEFDLEVPEKTGIAKLRVDVSSGSHTSYHEIELDVRNPNPPTTKVIVGAIEPGKTWSSPVNAIGIEGTNSAALEISSIPPIDLERRLRYLIGYPHGCVEQTTSKAFPQLLLPALVDLTEREEMRMRQNVKHAIERLSNFQASNGGFYYWPDHSYNSVSDWGTSYAGHFLFEAKNKGYNVSSSMLSSWISYQTREAKNWRPNNDNKYNYDYSSVRQAYRLYTLANAGSAERGAMNRLREYKQLSKQSRYLLAAAYSSIGLEQAAKDLISGVGFDLEKHQYGYYYGTFGSYTRDKAMILECIAQLKEYERGVPLMQEIAKEMSSQQWMSTQTTAWCLLAITKFIGAEKVDRTIKATVTQRGKTKDVGTQLAMIAQPLAITTNNSGDIKVKNNSASMIFTRVTITGTPAIGEEAASQSEITMNVKYTNKDGYSIDPTNLKQGENFLAKVTVRNSGLRGNLENMALTQIFPSGWEIENMRMDNVTGAFAGDNPTYQDIRDDRVYTYFDLNKGKSKTFVVMLTATYAGKYYLPSVFCEAMYDNTVNATSKGQWVNVVKE